MRYRWLAFLLFVALLLVVRPGIAWAHPEIVRTEPPVNAQLTESPARIVIVYNESIETAFADIQLFDSQAQRVDQGGAARSDSDPTVLELPLPALKADIYTVVWQVIGSDGHQVKGNYSFTLLAGAATAISTSAPDAPTSVPLPTPTLPPAIATPTSDDSPQGLLAVLRALMLLGALMAVGGWLFVLLFASLIPAEPDAKRAPAAREVAIRRWRAVIIAALILLLLAAAVFIIVYAASVASQLDVVSLGETIWQTRLGQAVTLRLGLALGLLLLAWPAMPFTRWRTTAALTLGAALLLSFSLSGHAAAQSSPLLPVLADLLHLLATTVWVGGLVQLAATLPVLSQSLTPPTRSWVLGKLIVRFSTLALASVIILTLSGIYSALLHLTALSDLWTSVYGQALLVKIIVFGGLLLVAAFNLLVVRPRFVAWAERVAAVIVMERWQRIFLRLVRLEVLLALLAVGAVGVLTNVAPPSAKARTSVTNTPVVATAQLLPTVLVTPFPTRTPVPIVVFDQTQPLDDLQVGLRVEPAGIGANTLTVTLRDSSGALRDVQKVELTMTMDEMDMGTTQVTAEPQSTGTYVAADQWLSMVGHWRVKVELRRADADDGAVEFVVPVGG